MASYLVEGPGGQKFQIEGPDGANAQQLSLLVKKATGQKTMNDAQAGAYGLGSGAGGVLGKPMELVGRMTGSEGLQKAGRGMEQLGGDLMTGGEGASTWDTIGQIAGNINPAGAAINVGKALMKGPSQNVPTAAQQDTVPYKVAQGLGQVGAMLPMGLSGGMLVGAAGGAEDAQRRIDNYEKEKGVDVSTGQRIASGVGSGAMAVPEALAARFGLKGLPLPKGVDKTVGSVLGNGRVRGAAEGVVAEGGQEFLQQIGDNALDKHIYKPEQEYMEGTGESAGIGGLVGGLLGGVHGRSANHTNIATPPEEVERDKEKLDKEMFGDDGKPKPQSPKEELTKTILDIAEKRGLDRKTMLKDPTIKGLMRDVKNLEIVEKGEAEIAQLEEAARTAQGVSKNALNLQIEKKKKSLFTAREKVKALEKGPEQVPGDGVLPDVSEGDIDTLNLKNPVTSEYDGETGVVPERTKSDLESTDVEQWLRENPEATNDLDMDETAQRQNDASQMEVGDLQKSDLPPGSRLELRQDNIDDGSRIDSEGYVNDAVSSIPPIVADESYQPDPLKGKGIMVRQKDDGIRAVNEPVQDVIAQKTGLVRPKVENSAESMREALNEASGQRVSGEGQIEENTDMGQYWETEADRISYEQDLSNYSKIVKEWQKTKDPKRKAELEAKINRIVDTENRIAENHQAQEKAREGAPARARKEITGERDLGRKAAMGRIIEEDLDKKTEQVGRIEGHLDADDKATAKDQKEASKSGELNKKLVKTKDPVERKKLIKQIDKVVAAETRLADRQEAQEKKRSLLKKEQGANPQPPKNDGGEGLARSTPSVADRDADLATYVNTGNMTKVLDHLAQYPQYKDIVDRLRLILLVNKKNTIELFDPDDITPEQQSMAHLMKNAAGLYKMNMDTGFTGKVYIKKGWETPHIVMHELIHAATQWRMNIGRNTANQNGDLAKAVQQLDDTLNAIRQHLQNEIKLHGAKEVSDMFGIAPELVAALEHVTISTKMSSIGNKQLYGLTNDFELIAEAMSNPRFQNWLKTVPPSRKTGGIRNMLTDFFQKVTKVLGFKRESALWEVMEAFDVITSQGSFSVSQDSQKMRTHSYMQESSPYMEEPPSESWLAKKTKGVKEGLNLVQSTADRMEKSVNAGLKKLGGQVREFVQLRGKHYGEFDDKFHPVVTAYKASNNKKEFLKQYSDFYKALQFGKPEDARAILKSSSPEVATAIRATTEALGLSGDALVKAGVQINRGGKVVPFEKMKNYFPLVIQREWRAAMHDPANPRFKDKIDQLTKDLIDRGIAKNREEALDVIKKQTTGGKRMDDFYGNIERSRESTLPSFIYDFTPDAVKQYRNAWSDRLAQIEAFGQQIGGKQTMFHDVYNDNTLTNEDRLFVAAAAANIYGETLAGDAISPGKLRQVGDILNNLAVFNQLVGVGAGLNNFWMGWALQTSNTGIRKSLKAMSELARDWEGVVKEARRMGIVRFDDIINLSADNRLTAPGKSAVLDIGKYYTSKAASLGLEYGTFNAAENHVRMGSFLTAKYNLAESLDAYTRGTAKGELFAQRMKREGIDINKLEQERHTEDKTETEKYYRKMVNLIHGSYQQDQIPLFLDHPIGKFFFKYYKFLTQSLRLFIRDKVRPIFDKSLSGNARARSLAETMKYLAYASLGGIGLIELKEAIFGMVIDDDELEQLAKALEDEKYEKAVGHGIDSMIDGLVYGGNLGLLSQMYKTADVLKDKSDGVYTPVKFKNPIEAPGMSFFTATINFALQAQKDGMKKGEMDKFFENVHDYAKELNRPYRETIRIGSQAASVLDDQSYLGKFQQNDEDLRFSKSMLREYMKEKKIKAPTTEKDQALKDVFSIINIKNADQYKHIKEQVRDAIIMGQAERANRLVTDHLKKHGTDRNSFKSIETSIKNGVDAFDPLYVNMDDDVKREIQNDFMTWARDNLPASDYSRIAESVKNYRVTAMKAGLWEPPSVEKARRERKFNLEREIKKRIPYDD